MEILKRGLEDNFVKALKAANSGSAWWKSIVNDPELFVTPRKTWLGVYYRGNRLLKLSLNDGRLTGDIHYKFLLNPGLKPTNWSVRDGQVEFPNDMRAFIPDFSDLDLLKRASKPYAGDEKYGVSKIIEGNPNIIDAEVAFSDSSDSAEEHEPPPEEPVDSKPHHNPRIDFVAVQGDGRELKLVFFEAKHFTNQELKSSKDKPRVVVQIEKYEKILKKHQEEIGEAYKRHCADMLNSDCVPQSSRRFQYLKMVSAGKLIVNTEPHLVVFGFDDNQKSGLAWQPHKKKLVDQLEKDRFGKDRVILRGNAVGLVRGVRFREP